MDFDTRNHMLTSAALLQLLCLSLGQGLEMGASRNL
jgi:hypothetical protein